MQITDVPHPGEFIKEELVARDWSQRDLAYVLGVPEQAVNLLVSGKRGISADMARALGDAFDVPAEFFVNLQTSYDLVRARKPDPNVARKGRLQSSYPVREMIKRGWLVDADATLLEQQMARFFEVASAEEIPHMPHAAKKSDYDDVPPAQLAWLFRVRQIAREMVVPKYSEKALRGALDQLRALMTAPEEARHVPRVLSECGVRFLVVECLPGSKIDGVCLWLSDAAPVIGMAVRHDRIDNFWFVLRHEIEHVLQKHGRGGRPVVDVELEGDSAGVGASVPAEERVANAAATDFCVPSDKMNSFIARKQPYFSERDMLAFAARLGVHPGLVAGQLRYRLNKWTIFSKHLAKIRSAITSAAVVDGWGEVAPTKL